MIKRIITGLMVVALAVGLVACGGEKKSDGQEFIVGFDAEFPPFGYKDGDDYVGFDLDLAQEVCKRNGWTYKAQPIEWDAKDLELDSGSISCIWNGFTYNGREDDYTWTVPYVDSSIVVCVKADSDINSLSDLAGRAVMVQKDSSGLAALQDEDNASLTESFGTLDQVADYNSGFMNLEAGAVDAIVVDIGVGYKQMAAKEGVFRMLSDTISVEQYAVGFKLGNEELRDAVQKTLFEMLDDGTFEEIANRWADDQIPDMICLDRQKR